MFFLTGLGLVWKWGKNVIQPKYYLSDRLLYMHTIQRFVSDTIVSGVTPTLFIHMHMTYLMDFMSAHEAICVIYGISPFRKKLSLVCEE